ncbi:MAG TPA: glycine/sarcosine/betaine reductase selenoprotein B family protein [Acidobacteriota bacterium]|nr:glycine/sarcosine/betaine reductase selenoprotein B family protein [Acidobacteriota bacterium]
MARLSDLKLRYQIYMRRYRYRSVEWLPGARLKEPLSSARLALVTTAALHLPNQPPFDTSVKGGDVTFRIIPSDTNLQKLCISHKSDAFDPQGIAADRNLAFPLERLNHLKNEGTIGSLNYRHFSFMGSITAPDRLISETAPEVARLLAEDQVSAVLLTPV